MITGLLCKLYKKKEVTVGDIVTSIFTDLPLFLITVFVILVATGLVSFILGIFAITVASCIGIIKSDTFDTMMFNGSPVEETAIGFGFTVCVFAIGVWIRSIWNVPVVTCPYVNKSESEGEQTIESEKQE